MSSLEDSTPEDDPVLRDALKRCSPATYYAACKFKKTREPGDLTMVVLGLVERFMDRELRSRLSAPNDSLRLREDLGLDSLTMMEIVMLAEEILKITVTNEELTHLRTLGEVQTFILEKTKRSDHSRPATRSDPDSNSWDIPAVGEEVRRIEANAARSITPLSN